MAVDVEAGGSADATVRPERRSAHFGGRVVLEVTVVVLAVALVSRPLGWLLQLFLWPFMRWFAWVFTVQRPHATISFDSGAPLMFLLFVLLFETIHGTGLRMLARELGLASSWRDALAPVAALAPLLVPIGVLSPQFSATGPMWGAPQSLAAIVTAAVFGGAVYQGYALGHLRRHAAWPWWKAAALVAGLYATADLLGRLYGLSSSPLSLHGLAAGTATAFAVSLALCAVCELTFGRIYASVTANVIWLLGRTVSPAGKAAVVGVAALSAVALAGAIVMVRRRGRPDAREDA